MTPMFRRFLGTPLLAVSRRKVLTLRLQAKLLAKTVSISASEFTVPTKRDKPERVICYLLAFEHHTVPVSIAQAKRALLDGTPLGPWDIAWEAGQHH